jgi:hypothetical protein
MACQSTCSSCSKLFCNGNRWYFFFLMKEEDEREPTIKELLISTAESLKEAYPSYHELTIGDILVGLASVAADHSNQNLLHISNNNPYLVESFLNRQQNLTSEQNPEGINQEIMELGRHLLEYATMVYHPKILNEIQKSNNEIPLTLFDLRKDFTVLVKERNNLDENSHAKISKRNLDNVLHFVESSSHMKQAFFSKIDFDLNALVISVRGTYSTMDVLTNFKAAPSSIRVHKHYSNCDEENYLSEEMIEGQVHGGFIASAEWLLKQNRIILEELFFAPRKIEKSEYLRRVARIDHIYLVGHSLGASVATVMATKLREYFLERRKDLQTPSQRLPVIQVFSYSPSALFSHSLSCWSRQFVHSFVIGGDLIPRCSLGQASILRHEMNSTGWRSKVENYMEQNPGLSYLSQSLSSTLQSLGFNPLFEKVEKEIDNNVAMLYPPGNLYLFVEKHVQTTETDFPALVFQFMKERFDENNQHDPISPTQLIHGGYQTLFAKPQYKKNDLQLFRDFTIRHVDARHFERIVLSPKMFSDHRLVNFYDALSSCLQAPLNADH